RGIGRRGGGGRPARARAARTGRRGGVRADLARRGRRDRGLLQRPERGIRDLQLGVHVVNPASRDVATILEALPYIREFHGKTIVIKYGGAAMIDPALQEEFARDVVLLKYVGLNPVVVHGGGPEITRYMERLGMKVEFGFVGEIERVDVDVLNHIAEDYIPVVASVGADSDGNSYNVNADAAAGAVAAALGAFKVLFLTDVEGWLDDPGDAGSRISEA